MSCHREEGLSWALTHHATAYRTLVRRDREKDLVCVGCHVTGMNAGGFDPTDDRSSPFTDVTCESCHKGGRYEIARTAIPALCASCHADPAYMRKFNPQVRVDQYAQYLTSVHRFPLILKLID